jgi:hypothetical protein
MNNEILICLQEGDILKKWDILIYKHREILFVILWYLAKLLHRTEFFTK